jgi:hypothetical protein
MLSRVLHPSPRSGHLMRLIKRTSNNISNGRDSTPVLRAHLESSAVFLVSLPCRRSLCTSCRRAVTRSCPGPDVVPVAIH